MPNKALRLFACLTLMLLSLTARAAVPAFTDFFGTNGILIITNGPNGHQKVQVDGRYVQPASPNLTNWSLLSTSVLGTLTATSTNTPSFGQLTSSGLTQSFGSGSATNVAYFGAILASSNVGAYPSGNGTFPYSGLVITNPGYYQFYAGAYIGSTTTVNLILSTNDSIDARFTAQSFPVTAGATGVSPVDVTGISYFASGDIVAFQVSTVPAAAVSISHAHIGMNKIDVVGGGSGSGSGSGDVTTSQLLVVSNQVNVASNYFSTNIVSLSTSNATSKPLTNSYVAGLLKLYGLEAGANVTITPNGTNLVIASSGGGAGETNYNTSASTTNSTRFAIDYGRLGSTSTNLLRTLEAGANITITNQGTNLIFAASGSSSVGALLYDPDGGVILFDP